MTEAPQYPVGPLAAEDTLAPEKRAELISRVEAAPENLKKALAGLTVGQLGTPYKNWNIRQIAQHLADSHAHCYLRFKYALTEEAPVVKGYDLDAWNGLPASRAGNADAALALFEGVHLSWAGVLRSMSPSDFVRTLKRPDGTLSTLDRLLCVYAWHARHHTGQILWLREQKGWK